MQKRRYQSNTVNFLYIITKLPFKINLNFVILLDFTDSPRRLQENTPSRTAFSGYNIIKQHKKPGTG